MPPYDGGGSRISKYTSSSTCTPKLKKDGSSSHPRERPWFSFSGLQGRLVGSTAVRLYDPNGSGRLIPSVGGHNPSHANMAHCQRCELRATLSFLGQYVPRTGSSEPGLT